MTQDQLITLHSLLGYLELMVARKNNPPNWETDELLAIREVQEIVEKLTM